MNKFDIPDELNMYIELHKIINIVYVILVFSAIWVSVKVILTMFEECAPIVKGGVIGIWFILKMIWNAIKWVGFYFVWLWKKMKHRS